MERLCAAPAITRPEDDRRSARAARSRCEDHLKGGYPSRQAPYSHLQYRWAGFYPGWICKSDFLPSSPLAYLEVLLLRRHEVLAALQRKPLHSDRAQLL